MNKEGFKYKYCYKVTLTEGSLKGKVYFGQHITNNLDDGYKGSGRYLKDYYKKYPNGYEIEIVGFYNTISELDKAEYELIHPHLNKDYCLNLIEGGHVNRMSEQLKKEISIKTKEAMKDPKIREKCGYWKGKHFNDDARLNISKALTEYFKTHEGNNTGKKLWPNGRAYNEEWYIKQHKAVSDPEYRKALSNRVKEMWANMTPEEKAARGQKIKEAHAKKRLLKQHNV